MQAAVTRQTNLRLVFLAIHAPTMVPIAYVNIMIVNARERLVSDHDGNRSFNGSLKIDQA